MKYDHNYPYHPVSSSYYPPYQANPYANQLYDNRHVVYPSYPNNYPYLPYPTYTSLAIRQQTIQGQATWTEGGPVTQCGIPWAQNEYMTAAVGEGSSFQCGQTLKIRYLQTQREVIVTIVDKVADYPQNKVNLHRRAFEALGANPTVGIINVEITSPELEEERWGKYLLGVTQVAYPAYRVTDYNFVERTEQSPSQTKEVYEFILQSPQERIKVQGTVIYNPQTDRIISFDITEI